MSADNRPCSRCGEVVSNRSPRDGVTQRIILTRTVVTWRLRFSRFRWCWLPKYADERVRESFTELDLCDWCAGDVFLFAQGLPPRTAKQRINGVAS
jgi:hypothetical protein